MSSQVSQTICQTALDNLGITAADIPPAFGPDTVWSYELGGKFRLFNRLQINLAAFRIDWKDVQVTTTLTCGQGFTANGGKARSEGGEMSVEYRPIDPLYLYMNASYIDAHYIDPVTGPVGQNATVQPVPSLNAGDKFNVPPFSMSAGAQVNFSLPGDVRSYVRLDGTYQNELHRGCHVRFLGLSRELLHAEQPVPHAAEPARRRHHAERSRCQRVRSEPAERGQAARRVRGWARLHAAGRAGRHARTAATTAPTAPSSRRPMSSRGRYGVQLNYRF